MSRSARPRTVGFNVAPMIDVVFLLIIFFSLVSTFAAAEGVRLELPDPEQSQARNVKIVDRVVINCRVAEGNDLAEEGVVYSVGPNPSEPLDRISERLAEAAASNPGLKVVVRADKRLPYAQVRRALEVVAENGIQNISLVAQAGRGED